MSCVSLESASQERPPRSHWEAQVLPEATLPDELCFRIALVEDEGVELLACLSQCHHVCSVEERQDGLCEELCRDSEEGEHHSDEDCVAISCCCVSTRVVVISRVAVLTVVAKQQRASFFFRPTRQDVAD